MAKKPTPARQCRGGPVKEVGGVKKFKELLDAMAGSEAKE
jgi:hypothetical protein